MDDTLEKNCCRSGAHLIKAQLQDAIRCPDKCVLLAECGTESVGRALVAKVMGNKREIGNALLSIRRGSIFSSRTDKKERR